MECCKDYDNFKRDVKYRLFEFWLQKFETKCTERNKRNTNWKNYFTMWKKQNERQKIDVVELNSEYKSNNNRDKIHLTYSS